MRGRRHSGLVYQAVGPAVPDPGPTVRVVVVLDVPTNPPGLPQRAVELADEFGIMMSRLLPGVQARRASLAAGDRPPGDTAIPHRGLLVDLPHRLVTVDGTPVRLAYREFELLKYLVTAAGRAVPRAELMSNVWADVTAPNSGAVAAVSERTVDTHVQRVRAKLGSHGRSLVTVRGSGYRFEPADDTRITVLRQGSRTG